MADKIAKKPERVLDLLKKTMDNVMGDALVNISKASIRSVFTVKKFDDEILMEDLTRIVYLRNLVEEIIELIRKVHQALDADLLQIELKNYARELFLNLCQEAILEEARNSDKFNLENHKAENIEYFEYIYSKLRCPE